MSIKPLNLSEHFKRSEFSCNCGCGFNTVDWELLRVLEGVRSYYGRPVIITSAARCKEHNRAIGSKDSSQHCLGKAADFQVDGVSPNIVADYLGSRYSGLYGIGRYRSWVHLDVRDRSSRWEG